MGLFGRTRCCGTVLPREFNVRLTGEKDFKKAVAWYDIKSCKIFFVKDEQDNEIKDKIVLTRIQQILDNDGSPMLAYKPKN